MSQQHINEMEIIEELEQTIEELELATQKSLSMSILGLSVEEAFTEPFEIMDKMQEIFASISDTTVKVIALEKIRQAIEDFNTKLPQVNR